MSRELSILLIEDDPTACNEISNCIEKVEGMILIATTNNVKDGIKHVKDYLPNVIILDLELHLGGGDGLTFLLELQKLNLGISPYILITTNNTSSVTYNHARKLGADFIMSKYQNDYSAENVIVFLQMISDTITSKFNQNISIHSTTELPALKSKRIKRRIYNELNLIGINPKSVGYEYLADAILLLIEGSGHNLSTAIGKKYLKTNSSVERAMQNAINRAWRTSDIDDLQRYYTARWNLDKASPTITEFIYFYANKIKAEY